MAVTLNFEAYRKGSCYLFALGRNAMYAVCKMTGLGPDDEVITPAYDCDGAIQPFTIAGAKPVFVRSDPHTLAIDLKDLEKKVTGRTKLVHIINHFGFPQSWDEIAAFRKRTGIPILEDNAYSLFSSFQGQAFGSFGDFSIFSLRKMLPVSEGGMLRVNNPDYASQVPGRESLGYAPSELMFFLKRIKESLGLSRTPRWCRYFLKYFNPAVEPPPALYSDTQAGIPEWELRDKIGSEFSCGYLRGISVQAESQLARYSSDALNNIEGRIREAYRRSSEAASAIPGVRVLWPSLPDGCVPFCLFILIEQGRDKVFYELRKKYAVMVWPTLPGLVLKRLNEFPELDILCRKGMQINLPVRDIMRPDFLNHLDNLLKDLRTLTLEERRTKQ